MHELLKRNYLYLTFSWNKSVREGNTVSRISTANIFSVGGMMVHVPTRKFLSPHKCETVDQLPFDHVTPSLQEYNIFRWTLSPTSGTYKCLES